MSGQLSMTPSGREPFHMEGDRRCTNRVAGARTWPMFACGACWPKLCARLSADGEAFMQEEGR